MKKVVLGLVIGLVSTSCTIYDDSDINSYECILRVQSTGDYHSSYIVSDCDDCFGSYGLDASCHQQ